MPTRRPGRRCGGGGESGALVVEVAVEVKVFWVYRRPVVEPATSLSISN